MGQAQGTPKILVGDDNAENRALAQATLDDEGYAVLLAASGDEALALFDAEAPDCVLLDVRMPGMDGFAVCAKMRERPHGAHVPIVFLTALRDVDTFDRALRVGGDDFLTKPVRPTELVVRVQAALKLRRMSVELREHYELVRKQRDDLMRLQLQKERLTEFLVHDLKNPVSTMDLCAQLMLHDPQITDRLRDSARSIREEARALLRLLLNLLDISKSEEGRLEPRIDDVDLPALVTEVVSALSVKAGNSGVRLEPALEVGVARADGDLLRRVLENLIDNALRHAPKGTAIQIGAQADSDGVELRIADRGPGVPSDMRESIFDRFVQLESGERVVTRTGRGLGLAFCKLALEAHGGRIWVEQGDPGAVFCLRLPA